MAEIPNRALTDDAPVYQRPIAAPSGTLELLESTDIDPPSQDWGELLEHFLTSPDYSVLGLCHRRTLFYFV